MGASGELIGINVAYVPPTAGAVSIGFAIPSPVVVDVVDELLDDGRVEQPFLGIALRALTPELIEQYGIDTDAGVLVIAVVPGGPADDAGIRPSDVITAIGDDAVGEPGDLAAALRDHEPGDEVEIELWRDGQVEVVEAVLGALPPDGG